MDDSKVAIITGASSGIGLAVAKRWGARGGKVALVARTAAKLEEASGELASRAPFPSRSTWSISMR